MLLSEPYADIKVDSIKIKLLAGTEQARETRSLILRMFPHLFASSSRLKIIYRIIISN